MADRTIRVMYEFDTKMQHAEIRCPGCKRAVIVPPKMMADLYGKLTALADAERRSRCSHCGRRGATIRGIYREYHG